LLFFMQKDLVFAHLMETQIMKRNIRFSSKGRLIASLALIASIEMIINRPCNLDEFLPRYLQNYTLMEPMSTEKNPSHIQICREITRGFQQHDNTAEIQSIDETMETCTCPSSFHAIERIYTSAILGESAKLLGLNMNYEHRCGRFNEEFPESQETVQMNLPLDLVSSIIETVALGEDDLNSFCSICLDTFDETGQLSDCILHSQQDIIKWIPAMTENVRMASTQTAENTINYLENGDSMSIESTKRERRKLLANTKTNAPDHDVEDVTVIYIDKASHDQHAVMGIPFYNFVQYIPRSATNIDIITSAGCQFLVPECNSYAGLLFDYVQKLSPRATITIQHSLNSQMAFTNMIKASTLICLPGLDCLLPALARNQNVPETKTAVVANGDEYPWLSSLPQNLIQHLNILPSSESWTLSSENNNVNLLNANSIHFLQTPPSKRDICPAVRGRIGSWVKDNDLAAFLQYKSPIDHIFGFADKRFIADANHPYREPTTYRWDEDDSLYSCPIVIQNHDTFCRTMSDLDISRVFFVGDFVGMNQAYSLWKLLGNDDSPKPITDREPSWTRTIECPNGSIQIQYVRNDLMIENDKAVDLPKAITNCGDSFIGLYCYKWTDEYIQYYNGEPSRRKTLMIASFGPHTYSEDRFSYIMTNFLTTLQTQLSTRLNQDYIFYRTSVPGHDLCQRKESNTPFKDFEEYRHTITSKFSWDLHDGFNDIAERLIDQFNEAQELNGHVHDIPPLRLINTLDIYPMTILRRDGHLGGKDCQDCSLANSCFHYSLPGPPDYWNHLLFSNLADIADIRRENDS